MRKYYVDNIRWSTALLVVLYHIIYMYNGVATAGVIGPFAPVQYQDGLQYLLYPWFMVILFVVSGISARCYLEQHSVREFVRSRTRKLLVPSTLSLLVFHWIQGYFSMAISSAFDHMPETMPKVILYLIMALSGTGVLWYIQMLWLFSMVLALFRRWEKGRLYALCSRTPVVLLPLLALPVWGSAQILNTPIIAVYRFGIYGFCFLLGYFLFAHETIVEKLSKYWHILGAAALVLGCGYVYRYFGENYAIEPVVSSLFSAVYGWTAVLALFAGMKRWGDRTGSFSTFMNRHHFGLYVFHYLPLSIAAWWLHNYTDMPALPSYLISGAAAYLGGFLLSLIVARIPFLRWCLLGIKHSKNKEAPKSKRV